MKNVLFILPDTGQAQALTSLLEQAGGYATRCVHMPAEFAGAITSFTPHLVVMNEQLPPDDMQAWARVITGLSPENTPPRSVDAQCRDTQVADERAWLLARTIPPGRLP